MNGKPPPLRRGSASRAAGLLRRENAQDEIYEKIYVAILEHRLHPGTKLGEERLASIFSVSRAGLLAMGKLASPKPASVKFILDLLKGKDEFIADAARALSGYEKAPGALRKDIVEDLIKMSEGVFSSSEANDNNAKKKWNTWGSDVLEALEKLSRVKKANPKEYRTWYNSKDPGGGKHPKTWEDPPKEEPKTGK